MDTVSVVIVNVAAVASSGIVTEAGTVAAAVFELESDTIAPAGAGPVSVSVPVADRPPRMLAGEIVKVFIFAAVTVRFAVKVLPPEDAVSCTLVSANTGYESIVKVAVRCPAGMVTVSGTEAIEESSLLRLTIVGLLCEAIPRETVPTDVDPPRTVNGLIVKTARPLVSTVKTADAVFPP